MMFLFPQPRSVENLEGTLVLPVGAADADLVTFFRRVRDGESGIRVEKDAALEREEYRIEVGEDAVVLTVSCDEGLFRAVTTLQQMLKTTGGQVPRVRIHDRPELKRRGYMLRFSCGPQIQ